MHPAFLALWLLGHQADGGMPSQAKAVERSYVVVTVLDVVELEDGSCAVVLASGEAHEVVMPIFIGAAEGLAIRLRLSNQAPPRPLTVDLLEEALEALGAKVVRVEVDDLQSGTFLGRITLASQGRVHTLEARPSDSIALALGAKVPIHVAKSVLERAGVPAHEVLQRRPTPRLAPMELPKTEL